MNLDDFKSVIYSILLLVESPIEVWNPPPLHDQGGSCWVHVSESPTVDGSDVCSHGEVGHSENWDSTTCETLVAFESH